jgi:hypothetical protein
LVLEVGVLAEGGEKTTFLGRLSLPQMHFPQNFDKITRTSESTSFCAPKYQVLRGSISGYYDEILQTGELDLGNFPKELVELAMDLSS